MKAGKSTCINASTGVPVLPSRVSLLLNLVFIFEFSEFFEFFESFGIFFEFFGNFFFEDFENFEIVLFDSRPYIPNDFPFYVYYAQSYGKGSRDDYTRKATNRN